MVSWEDQLWLSYLGVTIIAPTCWELHRRSLDGGNHKCSLKFDWAIAWFNSTGASMRIQSGVNTNYHIYAVILHYGDLNLRPNTYPNYLRIFLSYWTGLIKKKLKLKKKKKNYSELSCIKSLDRSTCSYSTLPSMAHLVWASSPT